MFFYSYTCKNNNWINIVDISPLHNEFEKFAISQIVLMERWWWWKRTFMLLLSFVQYRTLLFVVPWPDLTWHSVSSFKIIHTTPIHSPPQMLYYTFQTLCRWSCTAERDGCPWWSGGNGGRCCHVHRLTSRREQNAEITQQKKSVPKLLCGRLNNWKLAWGLAMKEQREKQIHQFLWKTAQLLVAAKDIE